MTGNLAGETDPGWQVLGRLVEASNATFLLADADGQRFVYKPRAGEAPLWDFPDGSLANREVAAYELSRASGFEVVPRTVMVEEAPLGRGALQRFVDQPERGDLVALVPADEVPPGWFGVVIGVDSHDRDVALIHADDPRLRRLALFDVIINNADRKAGHILQTRDDRVLGVDHGVSFHTEPKLRTVLWGWAGDGLDAAELTLVGRAVDAVDAGVLDPWLAAEEVAATRERATALLAARALPEPGERWPVIPWPPV